jgi:hypothetical protein
VSPLWITAGTIQPPEVPPGETAVDLLTFTGSGSVVTGTVGGQYAAPAFSASSSDPNPYLAELTGDSATVALGGSFTGVEVYVGSLDSYNTISFSNGLSYSGAALASMTTAADSGNQTDGSSNGLFYFVFSNDEAVHSVTFSSSGNSLEVAGLSASNMVVPEASTWVMMAMGFAGLGYTAFRRRQVKRSELSV